VIVSAESIRDKRVHRGGMKAVPPSTVFPVGLRTARSRLPAGLERGPFALLGLLADGLRQLCQVT
jgi:hypothetical protein